MNTYPSPCLVKLPPVPACLGSLLVATDLSATTVIAEITDKFSGRYQQSMQISQSGIGTIDLNSEASVITSTLLNEFAGGFYLRFLRNGKYAIFEYNGVYTSRVYFTAKRFTPVVATHQLPGTFKFINEATEQDDFLWHDDQIWNDSDFWIEG